MKEFSNFYLPIKHFNEVCRVCLSNHKILIPIKEINLTHNLKPNGSVENVSLTIVFQKFCNIEVSISDNKPQKICEHCINMGAKAFNFLQLFLFSNALLDKKLEENELNREESKQNESESNNSCSNSWALTAQCSPDNMPSSRDIVEVASSTIQVKSGPECDNIIASGYAAPDLPSAALPTTQTTKNKNTRRRKRKHPTNYPPKEWLEPDGSLDPVKEGALKILLKIRSKIQPEPPQQQLKRGRRPQVKPENDIFNCRFCKIRFHNITEVVKHLKDEHTDTMRCILCPTKFHKTQALFYHVAAHSPEGLVCRVCRLYFESNDSLDEHIKNVDHANTKKCPKCNKTFKSAYFVRSHIECVHLKKAKYQCKICGKMVKHVANLRRHELTSHGNLKFLCQLCGKDFTTNFALKLHMQRSHDINQGISLKQYKRYPPEKGARDGRKATGQSREPKFNCEYCQKKFYNSRAFLLHSDIHPEFKNYRCNICSEVLESVRAYFNHQKTHEKYQCTVANCSKMFSSKQSMHQHKQNTHRKPYSCSTCHIRFGSKIFLENHKNVHTGERPYTCEKCGQGFKQKSHLECHLISRHDGQKPRQCSLCDKAFSYASQLKNHMRSHRGERPFPCPYCKKMFTDTPGRHKHVKKDHPKKMTDFLVYKEKYQADEVRKAESEFEKTDENKTCTENDSDDGQEQ